MQMVGSASDSLREVLSSLAGLAALLGNLKDETKLSGPELQGIARTLDALTLQGKRGLLAEAFCSYKKEFDKLQAAGHTPSIPVRADG